MKLFENYNKALDLLENESDRFWARNNVFLLVQGAMIAFYAKANLGNLFSLLVSIEGFFLALIWIGVLVKGAQYVARWDNVVREIEIKLEAESNEFVGLKKLNDMSKSNERPLFVKFFNKRTTLLIRYFIYSLVVFWFLIFISNISKTAVACKVIKFLFP